MLKNKSITQYNWEKGKISKFEGTQLGEAKIRAKKEKNDMCFGS